MTDVTEWSSLKKYAKQMKKGLPSSRVLSLFQNSGLRLEEAAVGLLSSVRFSLL